MLAEGDIVGRFVVERLVGRGAMAAVYRVHDRGTAAVFALKVLDLGGPQSAERFAREAAVQAECRHPNIVALVEAIDVAGAPALVMEYVEGLNLDQVLTREPLDLATLDRLFADVCAGVEAAHLRGIVHRDLKPANVLVGASFGLRVAKVSDFGLVKLVTGGEAKLTLSNIRLGTPGYMAPEQALDPRGVDTRADLFSLGCILYRMATGHVAFPGDAREMFSNAADGRWTDPRVHLPSLPERYVRTIAACLQVDPDRRPQTVAELRALLRPEPAPEPDTLANALADLARMLAPPPAAAGGVAEGNQVSAPRFLQATRTVTPLEPAPVAPPAGPAPAAAAARPGPPAFLSATRTVTPLEAAPIAVPQATAPVEAPAEGGAAKKLWVALGIAVAAVGCLGLVLAGILAALAWSMQDWPRFG